MNEFDQMLRPSVRGTLMAGVEPLGIVVVEYATAKDPPDPKPSPTETAAGDKIAGLGMRVESGVVAPVLKSMASTWTATE
jgi:hypothetical protein